VFVNKADSSITVENNNFKYNEEQNNGNVTCYLCFSDKDKALFKVSV